MLPSVEISPMISMKFFDDLATLRPCCITAVGKLASARDSLFNTWTWAMFGSVPWTRVRSISIEPSDSALEEMYSSPSSPDICCRIGRTTVSDTVCGEAPG